MIFHTGRGDDISYREGLIFHTGRVMIFRTGRGDDISYREGVMVLHTGCMCDDISYWKGL